MTTYYKIMDCTDPNYEAGEIIARCDANNAKQARKRLGVHESNMHLYECVAESRLRNNLYDPRNLRRT